MERKFFINRPILDKQYTDIVWISESGMEYSALEAAVAEIEKHLEGRSKSYIKAKTAELLMEKGQLSVLGEDIFQEKLNARDIMLRQRNRWWAAASVNFREDYEIIKKASSSGALTAHQDFGHTSGNTRMLVQYGFSGLIENLSRAESKHTSLTEEQRDFYESAKIVLRAVCGYCRRLSECPGISESNAIALRNISCKAPQTMYEAMQAMIVYFYIHEYIMGTRVRTLGRLDEIFLPFYLNDLENGILTKESAKELWYYFLNKLWTMQVPYDLPFCIGGLNVSGEESTNELSYLIVEAYNELHIYSPKIHVRVSPKTPPSFVKLVLGCIRSGNSSFVFINDTVCIKAMMKCGVTEAEARDYVPVGCYEPSIFDLELPCTGNGTVTLPKAVEYVFNNGYDHASGERIGIETGEPGSYDDFKNAVKKQLAYMIDTALSYITLVEHYYMEANPDPLLSAILSPCVEKGMDAYAGGAKYNNSSLYIHSIATLADSIAAVRRLVFEEKRFSFNKLGEILRNNWEGHEKLRLEMLNCREKYGNNIDSVDSIAAEFSHYCASLINGRKNGRKGIFKASNFTIDQCFYEGTKTMATPDGRRTGDPNSKNLCAATAMDRNGITALISSVTKLDHSEFPNGSVLDIVLHPSAVSGEDGLDAFYAIIMTYFLKGGFAVHGNVFNAEALKKAQNEPEKYKNLQVRVCGWNAYFVNLSKPEQDAFIRQAENAEG